MLDIVCNNRQTIMTCRNGNQNIKVANSQSLASECMANIGIITSPVFNDWKNLEVLSYHLWFSQVFLYVLAMQSTVCEFCYRNLGSENLVLLDLRDMRSNTTTVMEILNPSVRIKDISFHNLSIVKINFTIKGTTIVAMLHCLVILLALSILRPYPFHLKEFRQGIVFSCVLLYLCRHNQLVCQPLTVFLRE